MGTREICGNVMIEYKKADSHKVHDLQQRNRLFLRRSLSQRSLLSRSEGNIHVRVAGLAIAVS
jgi:hypothetical protein